MTHRSGLIGAAETHLRLLRDDTDRTESLDRYYVQSAHEHGVGSARIAELSGIPLERVRSLLAGG